MTTFDLEGAARRLNIHPDTLAKRARRGEIAGAKIGRGWAFDAEVIDGILAAETRRQTEARQLAAGLVAAMQRKTPGRPRRARRVLPDLPQPFCKVGSAP